MLTPRPLFDGSQNASRVLGRRSVADPSGSGIWTVTEIDARGLPGVQGATCLLFDNGAAVRRVWAYPAEWRQLPDAALLALSWER